jgi:ATP-dependent Clp protease ATP-binding subunit ClpC
VPKINVYLPDDLALAVRETGLSVSPICQRALADAVRAVMAVHQAVEALEDPDFHPDHYPQVTARFAAQMTPRLRQAVGRALDAAGASRPVNSFHLLVGLIDEPDNMGLRLLESFDVDLAGLRAAAVRLGRDAIGTGRSRRRRARRGGAGTEVAAGSGPGDQQLLAELAPDGRRSLAGALRVSTELGHSFLGCEHLLLALCDDAGASVAGLLGDYGVMADALRRAIPAALAGATLGAAHAPRVFDAPILNRLDDIDHRLRRLDERLVAGGL